MLPPSRIFAASTMFSYMPPEQPTMTPCSQVTFPSTMLQRRSMRTLPPSCLLADSSTPAKIFSGFSWSSWIVQAMEGWKGRAIMHSTRLRSIFTTLS